MQAHQAQKDSHKKRQPEVWAEQLRTEASQDCTTLDLSTLPQLLNCSTWSLLQAGTGGNLVHCKQCIMFE